MLRNIIAILAIFPFLSHFENNFMPNLIQYHIIYKVQSMCDERLSAPTR